MSLVNAITINWKKKSQTFWYLQNLILLNHHLVKSNSLSNTEKLEPRELCCFINSSRNGKLKAQIYFEKKFDSTEWDWRVIYTLPRKVTINTYLRSFQYKLYDTKQYSLPTWKTFYLWTFYIILLLLQFFWWKYYTSFLWLYNNTMSLKKITVEIEK